LARGSFAGFAYNPPRVVTLDHQGLLNLTRQVETNWVYRSGFCSSAAAEPKISIWPLPLRSLVAVTSAETAP
jgi:hypothetical protein